jgi:hypothetical protein
VWKEAVLLAPPAEAKGIVASAIRNLPNSVSMWKLAASLETELPAKKVRYSIVAAVIAAITVIAVISVLTALTVIAVIVFVAAVGIVLMTSSPLGVPYFFANVSWCGYMGRGVRGHCSGLQGRIRDLICV